MDTLRYSRAFLLRYLVPSILAVSIVGTLVFVSWDKQVPAAAQLTRFYATDCNGGWKNVSAAAGEPTVTDGGYTAENSAVFLDDAAEIRCSGFTGDLPPQSYHTRAFVRLSWIQPTSLYDEETEHDQAQPDAIDTNATSDYEETETDSTEHTHSNDIETGSGNEEASTTSPVVTETATSSEELPDSDPVLVAPPDEVSIPISTDTELTGDEALTDTADDTEMEAEPVPDDTLPPAEVSWWRIWVPIAQAEEVSLELASSSEADDALSSTTSAVVIDSGTSTATTSTSTADVFVWPTESARAVTPQFRLLFSTTTDTWTPLVDIAEIDPHMQVELPTELVKSLTDFSSLHIRVIPLLQYDDVKPVYLDALWLEVDYEPVAAIGVHSISPLTPVAVSFTDLIATNDATTSATSSDSFTLTTFNAALRMVLGVDERFVLVGLATTTETQLWLFDMQALSARKIGYGDGALAGSYIIAKAGVVHWLNHTGQKIYSYDLRTPDMIHEFLLASNVSLDDEQYITFPFSPFALVWRGDTWYVSSEKTGEVFGDENSEVINEFLQMFRLSTYLTTTQIDTLELTTVLPVESTTPVAE